MVYTVTFNPAVDYCIHFDDIKVGEVNRARGEEIYFGGKGINVSVVLRELGIRSRALGFVAGFTGRAIERDRDGFCPPGAGLFEDQCEDQSLRRDGFERAGSRDSFQ